MKNFDIQVLGTGIVGHSLALALARDGWSVALRPDAIHASAHSNPYSNASQPPNQDVRAYALNTKSIDLLRSLKVWDALPAHTTTPVLDMQVQGDACLAQLQFSAAQQHVSALAWITDAAVLERELATAARFAPHITVLQAGEEVKAQLTALCEGKKSSTREALGVVFKRHDYGHTAIAARLTSTRAHQGVARQWFHSPDVLALLPFDAPSPGESYALVWSVPHERAQSLLAMSAADFEQQLMLSTQSAADHAVGDAVGQLRLASSRVSWPLMQATAQTWCGPGWVLLGDAAHVVHPLAGQGLNLGLADVVALVDVLRQREPWRQLGDEKLLRRYARDRLTPTWAMSQVTDGLLQLFATPMPVVRELRNRGLSLVNQLTPLKRWLANRALDS
jgi:ubiquinone biosynthesis UbiH/UbiF/VisC/COQ6 family hydroxylase